jgi:hypothetical protein
MRNETKAHGQPRKVPRFQRTAAAVIAQYIQELSHPAEPVACAPAA